MKNNKNKKAKIKNKRLIIGISSVILATSILIGTGIGIAESKKSIKDDYVQSDTKPKKKNETTKVETSKNDELNFYCDNYGDKNYLFLEEEDLLVLIEQAMQEVDDEYVKNGNKNVFNSLDKEYSQFTKYHILGLLFTESSLRLLEIKDESKSIFNVNNYARFYGTDKDGNIYYGPGMMEKKTVDYIVNTDRLEVNNFRNHEFFTIDGKQVKITFDNLNPYDYVLNSDAKTRIEIEQALKECIMLNVKSIYVYLNRLVKDNVKAGTHDEELKKLLEYTQFGDLSVEEKQISYALIAYNNGPTITRDAMVNKKLFNKYTEGENAGKYIINVKYANKVLDKASYYENLNVDLNL